MKIPKGATVRVDTDGKQVELHINACITTKAQAKELVAAILQCEGLLEEGERRARKPKVAAA